MINNKLKGVVLIADDNPDSLGMLNEVLASEGYTVFVALDGAQALAIAERMAPDIVLMDAIMPNMDGFDACKALKKNSELADIPVIFMTGLSESEDVVRGLEAGGVDYINKPVKLDELLARVKVHLNNSRMTRSARVALDEVGQLTFACDINGGVIWSTTHTRQLLASRSDGLTWMEMQLPQQLKTWLTHSPEKHNSLQLNGLTKPLQVNFLGRSSLGEYLMRLLDDDELVARTAFKERFELTEREAEVLFWLSRGKTNQEIGQILSMSPRTVNKHLEPIYRKLAVENRTTAASVCLQYLSNR
ncbi:response regulator transcription factor [Neptunomonas antarctica]|uniref:Two component transcriptional regulator, LuxR family n=1 Tax=Neptunomonas antarctica TaxID=619304 RepID=A0A1N7J4K2_9GAMM|nr:response regulator transcription factor [Neptunomonas antarctica]SIS44270.1 two component transcriptional regulator, LuxR family [Neptunomonas antarctica]